VSRARVSIGILLLVLLVGLGTAGFWAYRTLWLPTDAPETPVKIPPGMGTSAILDILRADGLVPSPLTARLYLETFGRGRQLRWGTYLVPAGAPPVTTLEKLLEGRVETLRLTVIEGMTATDIRGVLDHAGVTGTERWKTIVADTSAISDLAPTAPSLEGFLFPDTYTFPTGIDVDGVVRTMTARFRAVWSEVNADSPPSTLSVLDTVTLASLVEAETPLDHERRRVAGVFLNRLRIGMPLQCDPTVIFALRRNGRWTGRLLRSDWTFDDPYNTYRYPGLPPGPINNPGRTALEAALHPEHHGFLYFVADGSGGHTFSKTLKQHNRAVRNRSHH